MTVSYEQALKLGDCWREAAIDARPWRVRWRVPWWPASIGAMTRAPIVRFGSAVNAAQLMLFVEDPLNFNTLAAIFNSLKEQKLL